MLGFDYKIDKHKDTVLIDPTAWVKNDSNIVQRYKLSGKDISTYITKVLDIYIDHDVAKDYISVGDTVLLTRIVSDVAQYRGFIGPDRSSKYFVTPILQVIGVFKDDKISLDNLNVLFDKVIYEKVQPKQEGLLTDSEGINNLGKVVKVGSFAVDNNWESKPLTVQIGDTILVKDNISTEIVLDGKIYYVVDESGIIGISSTGACSSLDDFKLINRVMLMTPYIPEKMSKDSLLWTPIINYEDLDYSEIYCRNQFKINYLDKNLTNIKKGDIVIIDRNVTTYVYFNKQRYFVINGTNYIEGRKIQ